VVLRAIDLRLWVDGVRRFSQALSRAQIPAHRDHRVLERGALLLSSLARVDTIDRHALERTLDGHADELRCLLRGRPRTAVRCARALRELLGMRQGGGPGLTDHYDLRSALLDEVAARGKGTPIALAILYLLVGRRIGMCVSGVGLPDHVLVRVHGARSVLVDPWRGGRMVTHAECVRALRSRGYTGPTSTCMRELDDRALLLCLLASLRRVYGYREDGEVLQAIRRAAALLAGDSDGVRPVVGL
jgi:regulator of sirC expression with transglutaminase-like and TPR domain